MTQTTTDLSALRASLDGSLLLPGDETWDAARRGWAPGIDQQPCAVVHAASVADVRATVRFAARTGLSVAEQPRGHGASRALDGAILLRTGALDELAIDPGSATARIGAGVGWGRVQTSLDGTGLTGLAGSNPAVTVVPYLLGGGLSWFGRAYGVGARSLRSADVVDASGELHRVDAADDPDLLWALRGGGGDFAVVTAVEVDLYPAPTIYGGRLVFPDEAALDVLDAYVEVTRTAPDALSVWLQRTHVPDTPRMPDEVRGRSFVVVDAVFLGSSTEAEAHLAPVRAAGTVLRETMRPLTPGELGTVAEEPVDAPRADLDPVLLFQPLSRFDRAVAEEFVARTGREAVAFAGVRHVGGALADPPAGSPEGAGVRMTAAYLMSAMAIAPSPELRANLRFALDGLSAALAPWKVTSSTLTFLGDGQPLAAIFDAATIARLQEVKRTVDPGGVFRSNHPVLDG